MEITLKINLPCPDGLTRTRVILASSAFKELADVGAEDLDRGGGDTVVTTPPAAEVPAYVAVSLVVLGGFPVNKTRRQ